MSAEQWLLTAAIVVMIAAVAMSVVLFVHSRELRGVKDMLSALFSHRRGEESPLVEELSQPHVAFIANPSKPGVSDLKTALLLRCAAEELPEPLWLETTVEDPGTGQAREAIARGADLVVAVGGDGTVRAVATALTGTTTPMGILPLGTGNLLARNLDIPVANREEAFDVLLTGVDRRIDVGWLEVVDPDDSLHLQALRDAQTARTKGARERAAHRANSSEAVPADTAKHLFLVIAGVGFDAAMIADADNELKAKMGWVAYFVAGVRHLHGQRLRVRITLDDDRVFTTQLRTLMVGNCGRLPGGITLIPDAVIDDGIHDIAAIDTRGGLAGWVQLFGEVVMQGFGFTTVLERKVGRIDHTRAHTSLIEVEQGAQAQVDGDVIGRARTVRTWVDPQALTVRSPLPRLQ
ncbi:diacylglycerol/lipid kinase family protein [Jonesia denitrificans]|uniref:Diacylglycerol kinase catalytic region n=1 Tax=Jonesia denitrificans (strain ATCC 14870 / DSM 20603 / BCRC 15368 / CIP 55.134 / JCM 11481 / NBRC 15587 / NCTC 10816 / Prevot 55134) TaxID=471856 RepID=C7QZ30_JONDD|nr:diacylglycerol kinase family protein [Jonesia denitrificans]ACV07938.1 diacylglycerol kinase catalytic region [Jonesia denitrificans DSM 20603]ASE08366.1 diacylglycerol kinase [Jonesia denitrificans]QXB42967.1 NAD(+)/NADH kinase [Jonesia denitrificans]SQH19911.1 Diacylglycerol kinase [Jonesia denitrificans]